MLTIKHVENNGRERIFSATSIERTAKGELTFGLKDVIDTGKVYVMNEAGKTVGVYDCDKK